MFKLTQISDVHLGPLPHVKKAELFSKRITGYINWKRNRGSNANSAILEKLVDYHQKLEADHSVITGDLINLGLKKEIENVHEWLKAFSDPEQTTLICGNHDAYVKGAFEYALEKWQPWILGDDKIGVTSNANFPTIRRRDQVSIISCNSAVATAPFLALGKFDAEQGIKLEKVLKEEKLKGQCRVVMIHHPPFANATHRHKQLHGIKHFSEAIKQAGAELILHGHTHLSTINYIDGLKGQVPTVCVPAAYQWCGHHKPASAINEFLIEQKSQIWEITLKRHSLTTVGNYEVSETKKL